MANEVLYDYAPGRAACGVKLEESAVWDFPFDFTGATLSVRTLVTLIPIAPIRVPVGVSVTLCCRQGRYRPDCVGRVPKILLNSESARKEGNEAQ